jgi:hypothetical protein
MIQWLKYTEMASLPSNFERHSLAIAVCFTHAIWMRIILVKQSIFLQEGI